MIARLTAPTLMVCALASQVAAHPHVFIDTAFDLVFSEAGKLSAVRIVWTYDEFYSLLMIEENDLDGDGDGIPDADRLDAFAGKDVDWAAGFPGDFTITLDGTDLALDRPKDHRAEWRDGRIATSHEMTLTTPVEVAGKSVVARSYDPTYFVAYDVPSDPGIRGRKGCILERQAADRAAAQAQYGDALAAVDMSSDPFDAVNLPDIGILFADAFVLSCAAPS